MTEPPAPYQPNPKLKRVENGFENLIFNSRWLMAPFYFGLVISLAVLLLKFCMVLLGVHRPRAGLERVRHYPRRALVDRHLSDRQSDPDRGVFGLREFRLENRSRWPSGLAGLDDQGQFWRAQAEAARLDRRDISDFKC